MNNFNISTVHHHPFPQPQQHQQAFVEPKPDKELMTGFNFSGDCSEEDENERQMWNHPSLPPSVAQHHQPHQPHQQTSTAAAAATAAHITTPTMMMLMEQRNNAQPMASTPSTATTAAGRRPRSYTIPTLPIPPNHFLTSSPSSSPLSSPSSPSSSSSPSLPPSSSHSFSPSLSSASSAASSTPSFSPSSSLKRQRQRKTDEQIQALEEEFAKDPLPDRKVRDALGLRLGLSTRQVQIWFQNKRAKVKQLKQNALFNSQFNSPKKENEDEEQESGRDEEDGEDEQGEEEPHEREDEKRRKKEIKEEQDIMTTTVTNSMEEVGESGTSLSSSTPSSPLLGSEAKANFYSPCPTPPLPLHHQHHHNSPLYHPHPHPHHPSLPLHYSPPSPSPSSPVCHHHHHHPCCNPPSRSCSPSFSPSSPLSPSSSAGTTPRGRSCDDTTHAPVSSPRMMTMDSSPLSSCCPSPPPQQQQQQQNSNYHPNSPRPHLEMSCPHPHHHLLHLQPHPSSCSPAELTSSVTPPVSPRHQIRTNPLSLVHNSPQKPRRRGSGQLASRRIRHRCRNASSPLPLVTHLAPLATATTTTITPISLSSSSPTSFASSLEDGLNEAALTASMEQVFLHPPSSDDPSSSGQNEDNFLSSSSSFDQQQQHQGIVPPTMTTEEALAELERSWHLSIDMEKEMEELKLEMDANTVHLFGEEWNALF